MMKMKPLLPSLLLLAGITATTLVITQQGDLENWEKPTRSVEEFEEDDDEDSLHQWNKVAPWSAENAARHQKLIERYMEAPSGRSMRASGIASYAGGAILGEWKNRGANNMPGAFKFAEMLDGTDTVYGVTHNHYSGEFNSKSYIFKGTVYNPKSGTKGDDFVRLTGHWPNRYQDLVVIKQNNQTRLIAGIENGPIYYSDDDGRNWTKSSGLPSVLQSTIANRQESNAIYTTDGTRVYKSTDGGESFTEFQNFGSSANSRLYSPRYDVQPDAGSVYLARSGSFYTLSESGSAFALNGSYGSTSGSSLSIGGDSRKLYVTANSQYWVSTNGGSSWTQKYPNGNWYGERTGTMSAGKYLCVSPAGPDTVIGGYAQPVFSRDGLNTDISTTSGWGSYQNGTTLDASAYYDRIRFNYHPDFQASHFFYNSTGDLISVHCTDGGLFMSYKVWQTATESTAYNNSGYSSADFINITTLGTTCPLIYRNNMFTGYKDETHIIYSTQDQGTQSIIPGTSGESLDFYQSIGGDGPPLNSADGNYVWKWKRQGSIVWAPASMYDASGNMRSAAAVQGAINANAQVTFTESTNMGWVQTYIDHDAPANRMWVLSRNLDRATVNGTSITGHTVSKGTGHQVTALAQGHTNADLVWFLQEGVVYKSTNRGDSFDAGTSTPFTKTSNSQNFGGGWVLPTNDNWILFCGPSANGVGAILSKDGGATWSDVTGDFPAGDDQQTGGIIGSPDGKYVFAGTDIGPWVFVVETETWYPIAEGAAYFNTTAIQYLESTNTVRFGTWGSGVWDFTVQEGTIDAFITVSTLNGGEKITRGETVDITWSGYYEGDLTIELLKGGALVKTIATISNNSKSYSWKVESDTELGADYTIKVSSSTSGVSDVSDAVFSIVTSYVDLTFPNGGNILKAGGDSEILWESNLNGSIRIELTTNGAVTETLAIVEASVGSFIWSVDASLAGKNLYEIKLVSIDDNSVIDLSDSSFTVAEFLLLEQSHLSVYDVDSEHSTQRDADSTIDGDPTTLWHTEWSPNLPDFPHYVTYTVDTTVKLTAFSYLPRQDGSSNGRIKEFTVEVSEDDGLNWTTVKSSVLPNVGTETVVVFDQPISGTKVRFTGLSEHNGNAYASMAEFNLYYVHEDNQQVARGRETVQNVKLALNSITPKAISLQVPQAGNYSIRLIGMNGRVLVDRQVELAAGIRSVPLGVTLGKQIAILQIAGGNFNLKQKVSIQ